MNSLEAFKMPPLGHEVIDSRGVALLETWIRSLPGPPVLEPPTMTPQGGEFDNALEVQLTHRDSDAIIRYTLDGSAPGKSAVRYKGPFMVNTPVTVRARAYKEGFTRSIPTQETYIVLQ
jgi:hypothetical protein